MLFTGVVCGFGGYSEQQLEQMRLDLNLCMPLHKLKACTMYYKNTAKRDPFIEEIRFLDRFLEKATHSPTAVAPRELLTNDPFVAKTYADLVEKRRKISPDAQKPCSLSEAFELMSAYLGRVGKTVSLSHEAFSLEDLSDLPELAESPDLLSTKDAGYGFRRAFRPKQTFENTDLLVILAPSKGLTPAEEAIAFNAFLSNDSFTSHAKTIRAIGELGVLYEILSLAAGAAIDLDALATADKDRELDALVTDHLHHYLLRISNQSCDFLAKSVKSIGLCVLPVATLANPQTVSIGHGQRIDFSWSSDFIRSLFAFTPVSMHLRDEVAVEAAPIQNTLHRVGACAYFDPLSNEKDTTLSHCGNTVYTAASCAPTAAFFRNALDTALCAVIKAALSGISYTEQRLAVGLNLPTTLHKDETASDAMSAILGLYRLEAELAIPMTLGKLTTNEKYSHPKINVFGLANGDALSDHFAEPDHRLYCVMPEYGENGIPNFETLRVFLDWLTALSQSGSLKSARVICRQSLCDVLSEMNTDSVVGVLTEDVDNTTLFPLAVLLEVEEEIDAAFVGYTQANDLSDNSESTQEEQINENAPESRCLIWTKIPTVLIYANPDDRDAHVLSVLLTKKGAIVKFRSPTDDWTLIATALLQTQTLILGKNAALPDRPEIRFAVETLARANGRIIAFENVQGVLKDLPITVLEALDAITADQICKKADC